MDMPGHKYFITFIDEYSRYMYVYLLHNKYEALNAFKVFEVEVENQCMNQIQIVRFYRGDKYYGRYIKNGQAHGPFAKFLQEHWGSFLTHYAWFFGLEWCSRKK